MYGYLYGTNTKRGEKLGLGVLFHATLAGELAPASNFTQATGAGQPCPLLQHTNSILYEILDGENFDEGVFYSFNAGLPPFASYLPTHGRPGALVQETASPMPATFFTHTRNLQTRLSHLYPSHCAGWSHNITVTTANDTTSNKVFIVHP